MENNKKVEPKIILINLDEKTPHYVGYTDLLKVGNRYFRSWDAEGYNSGIREIDEEEYKRLLQYKIKRNHQNLIEYCP